jgi:hypothetical protein
MHQVQADVRSGYGGQHTRCWESIHRCVNGCLLRLGCSCRGCRPRHPRFRASEDARRVRTCRVGGRRPRSPQSECAPIAAGGSFVSRKRGGGVIDTRAARPLGGLHLRMRQTSGLESPAGRAGVGGGEPLNAVRRTPPPLPGRDGLSHAVHGLRFAPPVATGLRPVGAKNERSGKGGVRGLSLYMFRLCVLCVSVVKLLGNGEVAFFSCRHIRPSPPRADRRLG